MFVVGDPVPFLKWYNFVKKNKRRKKTNVKKTKQKMFLKILEKVVSPIQSNIKKTRSTPIINV